MELLNMRRIGQGNTAEVYEFEENKVMKLFRQGMGRQDVMWEYQTSVVVQDIVENVPKAYSLIECNNRYGIVYEKIEGKNLLDEMLRSSAAGKFTEMFVQQQREIHKHQIPSGQLPSVKEKLTNEIQRVAEVSPEQKEFLFSYIRSLPDGHSLCHFDYHPGNIILRDQSPIVIDWVTACYGDPCADVARTYILLCCGEMPNESLEKQERLRVFQDRFLENYFQEYLNGSGRKKEDVEQWIPPIAAARLQEWVPEREKQVLLSMIQQGIAQRNHP